LQQVALALELVVVPGVLLVEQLVEVGRVALAQKLELVVQVELALVALAQKLELVVQAELALVLKPMEIQRMAQKLVALVVQAELALAENLIVVLNLALEPEGFRATLRRHWQYCY
jgi:hypothetical protein